MDIKRFSPSPRLANFVKCYYYIENTDDRLISDVFFADGCVEAVFSLGWDFYKDGVKEDWAKIIGQILKPRQLNIHGKGESFGVWFYPHTFSRFSRIPMFDINDSVLSWDALFPGSFAEFAGNCIYEGELDRLVRGVDEFLFARLIMHNELPIDRIVDSAIRYLYSEKENSDLNQLASSLNVSHRYLQRAFLKNVGFSQKQFIRIIRFQQALRALSQGEMASLTALTYANNFYDQSHFIREFKAFTGLIPSEFEATKLPINRHFIASD